MIRSVLAPTSAIVLIAVVGCGGGAASERGTARPRHRIPASFAAAVERGDDVGFTRRAARLLARVDGLDARMIEPGAVEVRSADDDLVVSLRRPYASCREDLASCDSVTEDYLRSIATVVLRSAEEQAATPERLRLAIRPTDTILTYRRQMGDRILSRPLVAELHTIVLVDFPESARPLLRDELAAMGLDEEAAFTQARANVLEELGPFSVDGSVLAPGRAIAIADQRYYESSRILDTALLSDLERRSGGPILLVVPTFDAILIATASDPSAPAMLAAMAREAVPAGGRPLGTTVLRFANGQLAPASPRP